MKVQSITSIANGIELETSFGKLRVQFHADNIVRVIKMAPGAPLPRASLAVLPSELPLINFQRTESSTEVILSTEHLSARIERANGMIHFCSAMGDPLLSEQGRTLISHVSLPYEPNAFSIQESFTLAPDEAIYGLGQHQDGQMNYRGQTVKLVQANTMSAIPFLVSTRGYGILWDNASSSRFEDGPGGASFYSEVADAIDYYFIAGGTIDGAIAGYRKLTGDAPMYGKWAYGYWQSKEHYEDRRELLNVAAEYRRRQIPIDGIVQDWDYWVGRDNWSQMYFDPVGFPEPKEMVDILHSQHFHFMISIWSGFGPNTPIYKEMEQRGFLHPTVGWAGFKYYDAHNPEAVDLYWKYAREGLFSKGLDGWWMDSTEPDIVNAQTKDAQEYEMKRTGTNHLGSFARYLNTYPLVSTEGVYRNQRKDTSEKRVYILTRSVFAGQQRAAATTWSGDIGASWRIYRNQISAGVNHSMSGVPYWTFDIGAFVLGSYGGVFCDGGKDPAYQELYTRMFQLGAFSPIFRSHGSETPREIWEFDSFSPVLERFDHLRYRLMPYIYSQAWRITHEGASIMRGLPMDFPADRATHGIDTQFLFGSSLMVCPVTEYMLHRPPEPSVPVPASAFKTETGKPGIEVTYFSDDTWTKPVRTGVESDISLNWYTGWPDWVKDPKFSMRWRGKLIPTQTGPHRFHVKSFGPRILKLDGKEIEFNYKSTEAYTVPVELVAGREYTLEFATGNNVLGAFRAQLWWKTPDIIALEKKMEVRKQTRDVYLPAGTQWIDFWTGETFAGGQTRAFDAPIQKIPLLLKAGSILPLGPVLQYAAEKHADPLELRIYPGADGDFTLYEDENDTYNYEKGVRATISFHWDNSRRELSIGQQQGSYPGMPLKRTFRICLVRPGYATGIDPSPTADLETSYDGTALSLKF